ncbi:tubulin-like doman-containing protein [Crossiella sp. CA198]|uniref:tubulin-like doman-containing protein n=1 Tax=Crossiella sp. CA198 TaxID=3455607 RepID=UPI003F8CFD87
MALDRAMLLVGIGGTGLSTGQELERVLRNQFCGPDGTDLISRMRGHDYRPYQLPSCVQFAYIDLNMTELSKVLPNVVPSAEHHAAAQSTTNLIANLVPPNHHNSAQVQRSLRISTEPEVIHWLPSPESDPRVAPLDAGAGQLPTVARAALFETMRQGGGPNTVLHGVTTALQRIGASGPVLRELGGTLDNTLDVFVVFSVAGGTGCGLFLDYLYLIGDLVRQNGVQPRIYPLVLLPSAFPEGMGGGRPAVLNAASALVDLFRLIDDQNAQGVEDALRDGRQTGGRSTIRVPGEPNPIGLQPATVQTAFLFGRPDNGIGRADLIRSMVSLIMALVSAGSEGGVPFADRFVNDNTARAALADSGVGRCGLSTASVASLSIPLGELADLVGSRLLAEAVRDMRATPSSPGVQNRPHIERFDTDCGLDGFRACAPLEGFAEVEDAPVGYDAILRALNTRIRSMQDSLERNAKLLDPRIGGLAKDFTPVRAAEELLRAIDPFHLRRVLQGDPGYTEGLDKGGFERILKSRMESAKVPPGYDFGLQAPQPEALHRRAVLRRPRWGDDTVQNVVKEQNAWYHWRLRRQWHEAWARCHRIWEPRWLDFCGQVAAMTGELTDYLATEERQFTQRSAELYERRLGVSYLLPPDDGQMQAFYQRVKVNLINRYRDRLPANTSAADLVSVILGTDGWREAYRAGRERPGVAVHRVRQRIRRAVSECLRPGGGERAIIPAMRELLTAAAGRPSSLLDDADVAHFRNQLAGMVPSGYAPSGEGTLKVLISYPAGAPDLEVEACLGRELLRTLQVEQQAVEFRPNDSDSLVVVLFRSSMSITQVPEVREAIRLRSAAQRHERPGDRLSWRQRLGTEQGYPVSTPADRALILQSFLNAMWNGWVQVEAPGQDRSPTRVRVRAGRAEATPLVLELTPFGGLSSWASLLQAYEEWALSDGSGARSSLAAQLIAAVPLDIDRNPAAPAPLFSTLYELPAKELRLVDELRARPGLDAARQIDLIEEFWQETLPAALDLPFRGVQAPFPNLRGMTEYFACQSPAVDR